MLHFHCGVQRLFSVFRSPTSMGGNKTHGTRLCIHLPALRWGGMIFQELEWSRLRCVASVFMDWDKHVWVWSQHAPAFLRDGQVVTWFCFFLFFTLSNGNRNAALSIRHGMETHDERRWRSWKKIPLNTQRWRRHSGQTDRERAQKEDRVSSRQVHASCLR